MKTPAIKRLFQHVKKTSRCWNWTGALTKKGYARLLGDHGKNVYAHRLSYEGLIGPVPEGMQLDHLCRNHRCVNPKHLEPVTARENVLRGVSLASFYAKATHCKYGHPFDKGNTKLRLRAGGTTERICKKCKYTRHLARLRRIWAKRRAERAA